MQFIKKNYEKILLGLVLIGLVVVAVFLMFLVSSEKEEQARLRDSIHQRTPKALPDPDLTRVDALLHRVQGPLYLNFSDSTNKLFNPERWQKPVAGPLIKNPVGTVLDKLEALKPNPLYLKMTLDNISTTESGTRFGVSVEQQAAIKPASRGRRLSIVSKGEKKEFGEKKESFTVVDVQGPPDNPVLTLELSDSSDRITLSKDKPFQRVDGFTADLSYPPERKQFLNRREGSTISVAGEDYDIVRITETEVTLQGKNGRKWPKKFNTAPQN
jgi:hypothetical protein